MSVSHAMPSLVIDTVEGLHRRGRVSAEDKQKHQKTSSALVISSALVMTVLKNVNAGNKVAVRYLRARRSAGRSAGTARCVQSGRHFVQLKSGWNNGCPSPYSYSACSSEHVQSSSLLRVNVSLKKVFATRLPANHQWHHIYPGRRASARREKRLCSERTLNQPLLQLIGVAQ